MRDLYDTIGTISAVQDTLMTLMRYSSHMFTVLLVVVDILMLVDSKRKRISHYGGSIDHIGNATDSTLKQCHVEPTSRSYSASANYLAASGSTTTSGLHSRPKGHNSDGNLYENFTEGELPNKQNKSRPNSLENSENASTNSSPLNLKGSFNHIHGKSESFSSEDMMVNRDTPGSSRDGLFGSTSSTIANSSTKLNISLARNGLSSYDIPHKNIQTQPVRHRSTSPGSEMVTLEEFLEESSRLSLPHETPARDDLLSDYFRKANEHLSVGNQFSQANRKETTKTPTSCVSPTAKLPGSEEDGRLAKPGHYCKADLRLTEPEPVANPTGAYMLPHAPHNQPSRAPRQTTQAQPCSTASRQSSSLNRTFSLASADLLRATGPEVYRRYDSLPKPVVTDTQMHASSSSQPSLAAGSQVCLRERPQSAKVAGSLQNIDSRFRQLDVRRLSLAAPKDEKSLLLPPFSTTTSKDDVNIQPQERAKADLEQRCPPPQYAASKMKGKPASRPGEVATIAPVRVVSHVTEESNPQALTSSDTSFAKCQSWSPQDNSLVGGNEDTNRETSSKNPPTSPDPQGDQQTVWYEYGCV